MIDVSGDSVRQSQHALTLTLTLTVTLTLNPVALRTSELSPKFSVGIAMIETRFYVSYQNVQ